MECSHVVQTRDFNFTDRAPSFAYCPAPHCPHARDNTESSTHATRYQCCIPIARASHRHRLHKVIKQYIYTSTSNTVKCRAYVWTKPHISDIVVVTCVYKQYVFFCATIFRLLRLKFMQNRNFGCKNHTRLSPSSSLSLSRLPQNSRYFEPHARTSGVIHCFI